MTILSVKVGTQTIKACTEHTNCIILHSWNLRVGVPIWVSLCIHVVHTCISYICIYELQFVCEWVCMCECTYVCMHVHTCLYMFTFCKTKELHISHITYHTHHSPQTEEEWKLLHFSYLEYSYAWCRQHRTLTQHLTLTVGTTDTVTHRLVCELDNS